MEKTLYKHPYKLAYIKAVKGIARLVSNDIYRYQNSLKYYNKSSLERVRGEILSDKVMLEEVLCSMNYLANERRGKMSLEIKDLHDRTVDLMHEIEHELYGVDEEE